MGCSGGKSISQFDTQLDVVNVQSYDEFYARASARLDEIKADFKEIEEKHTTFLLATGLMDRNLSLGHGLAAMLVAVASENENDFIACNLQFDDNYPGILLDKRDLSDHLRQCYEAWEDLSKFLAISINKMSDYIRDIPLFNQYAQVIPDELLKRAFDSGTEVFVFKQQEEIAVANAQKIGAAQTSLDILIDKTHSAIHDTTEMIDRLRNNHHILKLLSEIAVQADSAKVNGVPTVLAKYSRQIDEALQLTRS